MFVSVRGAFGCRFVTPAAHIRFFLSNLEQQVKAVQVGKGKKRTRYTYKHVAADSVLRWGGKPGIELNDALKAIMAAGFYPVGLLSRFEILLEEATTS